MTIIGTYVRLVPLDTAAVSRAGRFVKRSRMVARLAFSGLAVLGVTVIPTSLFAQASSPDAAPVAISDAADALRPAPAERMSRRPFSDASLRADGSPPVQRAASRDSVRNGAVIGALIGAAAFGTLAATLCHVYREPGGPSCVPDAIRFAAIGGAIGLGAGIAIDVARSPGPMVRVTVAF